MIHKALVRGIWEAYKKDYIAWSKVRMGTVNICEYYISHDNEREISRIDNKTKITLLSSELGIRYPKED